MRQKITTLPAMNRAIAEQAKQAVSEELKARNIPASNLCFLLPQMMVETAGFTSKLTNINNFTGIIYVGQSLANDSGIPLPAKEREMYGDYNYASFDSVRNWTKEYLNILQRKKVIPAKDLSDFANKLKAGRYFTASLEDYKKALCSWLPQLKKTFSDIDFSALTRKAINPLLTFILIGAAIYAISKNS